MNINIKQLRIFIEVAQRRSMIHAAAALHLTPPAVSMQIKEIEKQLGLSLFDRSKRRVSLSTAGEYFVVYASRVLANLKEAEDAMAQYKQLDRGSLTIGIASTAAYFMPKLLAQFHSEHPGVDVRLRVVYSHEQSVSWMNAGTVDLMVLTRPLKELTASAESFAANPLVFVCPPKHPLVGREPLSAKILGECNFIAREQGTPTRAVMDAFLAKHRSVPRVTMEIPNNETIKQAVMAGMGLSFLSLQTIALELRNGLIQVLDIQGTPVMDVWNIVHLRSKVLSPAAEAFRSFVMDQGQKHLHAQNSMLMSMAFKQGGSRS